VVVDDVEDDAEPLRMGSVDEAREPLGPAVGRMRGEGVEPVVAPAALARIGRDGHHLDRGHAELAKRAKLRDDAGERPLLRERADVQLVEDEILERDAVPRSVGPLEARCIDDLRRAAHAVRLRPRARVGIRHLVVDREEVLASGRAREAAAPQSLVPSVEQVGSVGRMHGERARFRRPHAEVDGPVVERDRPEALREWMSSLARHHGPIS
jgi:hypothetical protein